MTRDESLLQGLKQKMQGWLAFIQKTAMATKATIEPAENGEFFVVVQWEKPEHGEYKKHFDRPTVFGSSMRLHPLAWTVQRCVGDFSRDVVREVLQQRGV
jgi:hypothetical protein